MLRRFGFRSVLCGQAAFIPVSCLLRHLTGLPVARELVEELCELLERAPSGQWLSVAGLYNDLSLDSRRRHVRPHRTLAAALSKVQAEIGVSLDDSGLFFCKGPAPSQPQSTDTKQNSNTNTNNNNNNSNNNNSADGGGRINSGEAEMGVFVRPALRPSLVTTAPDAPAPVDFYYDVGLREHPPAPPDFDVTTSTLRTPKPTASGAVLALSSFVTYIPPFFVPLAEVLQRMPGYTEAHVEMYLKQRASELVSVFGTKYIRLHGGYARVPLDGCEVAESHFAAYRPDPTALHPFVAAFGGVTGRWMPLRILLERAGPAAVARLPFRGPAAIIYFAQMQHVFAFAVDADGGSVLLRPEGYGGLECETTPTPKACNAVLRAVPLDGQIDICHVERAMSPEVRAEVESFYGTVRRFLQMHAAVFWLSADGSVVMRRRCKDRLDLAQLSLEEQLEVAVRERNKKRIRAVRRRIAFKNDPSHPFHDPDNLARELHRYVPKKGHVSLKMFLKKNVPEELLNFLPRKFWNFFTNYPQYFQQFEYQTAGKWCISRPGQPLPRGVIRQEFSEEDLVRLVAELLQQRGPRACSALIVHMPRGAQEAVRKRYGGMFYLVTQFPQYFNVMLASETGNVRSGAVVHLVELPGAEFIGPKATPYDEEHKNVLAEAQDGEDDDEEDDMEDDTEIL